MVSTSGYSASTSTGGVAELDGMEAGEPVGMGEPLRRTAGACPGDARRDTARTHPAASPVPRDARVVVRTAGRDRAHLLEHLTPTHEVEMLAGAEPPSEVADHVDVGPARHGGDGLIAAHHAAFDRGDRAFLLGEGGPGQHHGGVPQRRLGQERVDHDDVFERRHLLVDAGQVGGRDAHVVRDRQQALDLAAARPSGGSRHTSRRRRAASRHRRPTARRRPSGAPGRLIDRPAGSWLQRWPHSRPPWPLRWPVSMLIPQLGLPMWPQASATLIIASTLSVPIVCCSGPRAWRIMHRSPTRSAGPVRAPCRRERRWQPRRRSGRHGRAAAIAVLEADRPVTDEIDVEQTLPLDLGEQADEQRPVGAGRIGDLQILGLHPATEPRIDRPRRGRRAGGPC